jgi:hypothetical protein
MYCNLIGNWGKSTVMSSLNMTKFILRATPFVRRTFSPCLVGMSSFTEYRPPFCKNEKKVILKKKVKEEEKK